jgi:hypothetical protein
MHLEIACALTEALDCGQRDILLDFSLHLFVPANGKKEFYTCIPPKQRLIRLFLAISVSGMFLKN